MLAVHLGILPDELATFKAQLSRTLPEELDIQLVGSRWDDWYDRDIVKEMVVHVIIPTKTPMVLLNLLVSKFEFFFQPMGGDDPVVSPLKVILTDEEDFGTVYHELSWPDVLA